MALAHDGIAGGPIDTCLRNGLRSSGLLIELGDACTMLPIRPDTRTAGHCASSRSRVSTTPLPPPRIALDQIVRSPAAPPRSAARAAASAAVMSQRSPDTLLTTAIDQPAAANGWANDRRTRSLPASFDTGCRMDAAVPGPQRGSGTFRSCTAPDVASTSARLIVNLACPATSRRDKADADARGHQHGQTSGLRCFHGPTCRTKRNLIPGNLAM